MCVSFAYLQRMQMGVHRVHVCYRSFFTIPLMFPLVKLTMKLSPAPASVRHRNQCNNYVCVGPWQCDRVAKKKRTNSMMETEESIRTSERFM